MPGVLIVEAMAQTAGVLVLHACRTATNKLVLLVAIEMRASAGPWCPATAAHGDEGPQTKASVAKMAGVATVDGVVVAEAEVMCKLADKEEKQPARKSGP